MQTIVDIFIFINRENFMLSWVEQKKKFYNLGAWPLGALYSMSAFHCNNIIVTFHWWGREHGLSLLAPAWVIFYFQNTWIQYVSIDLKGCRVRWFSWMRVRLVIRRLRVRFPLGRQHSFVEIWPWNIFYGHSLPFADSRRAVVSFWRKNLHNTG